MPAIYHTKAVDDTFEGAKWHAKPATVVDDTVWHCNAADANFQGAIFHIKWVDNSYDGPVIRVTGISPGGQTVVVGPAVSPLSLPNAVANSLQYVKAFGGTIQNGVPQEYTRLEYIESTGTQYIDLGIKGNGNTKVEIKFKYHTVTSATGSGRVFGSRNTSQIDAFAIGSASGVVSATTNKVFWCYDGQPYFVDDTGFGLDVWRTIVFSATEHTIDGVSIGNDYTVTTFETPNNLKLFAFDNNGTNGVGYVDVAYCKVWDNGVLIRDLVPAKNGSNVIGMYDRVSGQFLTNAGTGNFVAGTDVVPAPGVPTDIICNNGVLKHTANEANYTADNVTLGYWIRNNNGQPESSPANFYTAMMPVKPNVSYVCFGRTKDTDVISGYNRIAWYDADGVWIRNSTYTANTPGIDTSPANAVFARFHCNPNGTEVTQDLLDSYNWVFQQGTAEVPYTPYSPTKVYTDGPIETIAIKDDQDTTVSTAICEDLLSIGTYTDQQEIIDGTVTRKVGVLVLDGTETWTKASGYTNIFYTNAATDAYYNDSSAERIPLTCTHLTGTDATNTNMQDNTIKLTAQGAALTTPLIYIKASVSGDNLTTWQNWLAAQYANGTPVIIVYPLKADATETVTGQTLQVQNGANTLTITQAGMNGLQLEAEYEEVV